jgi:hypothetical protein
VFGEVSFLFDGQLIFDRKQAARSELSQGENLRRDAGFPEVVLDRHVGNERDPNRIARLDARTKEGGDNGLQRQQ